MDYSLPGFSVHRISQVRILEWVAISFSRGSSRLRDGTCISCTGRWFFTMSYHNGGLLLCTIFNGTFESCYITLKQYFTFYSALQVCIFMNMYSSNHLNLWFPNWVWQDNPFGIREEIRIKKVFWRYGILFMTLSHFCIYFIIYIYCISKVEQLK